MVILNDKVSVIIPTYNRSELLKKAVKSLENQSHQNFEIIIIDDFSTDDTAEVVQEMQDDRIIYLKHDTNKGGSEARNTGIKMATGRFIGFLDSDDQWLPDKLEKQLQLFADRPDVGVIYTGVQVVNENNQPTRKIIPEYQGNILSNLFESNCIDTTSSVLVKKEVLDQVQGFDAGLPSCQDWDLYIRLAQVTKFDYVKESMVLFYHHSGERITTNKISVLNGHLSIFKKYKELARKQRKSTFQRFVLTIWKVIFRTGIVGRNKETIQLSRRILSEGFKRDRISVKFLFYYLSTFLPLEILSYLYIQSKKNNRKSYLLSATTPS
ncbi:glycosyl transferase family 2 [Planococcus antarcticus DSM 14505]|uniref:Glycosyl transferase n=1 Tax=Planococcus antarcticus DSM 14505 TaxID=1185653 RepID=A0A1C7DFB6_9BACL|nr:glycosyltransferase family 2 protein [Planococcus antarcticus]ANU10186.1 glycosyl transferase [Planococcus antarcticus DSM 14505]EIM06136.1 glycosyl transferase family 2 [Planococcus antarcticus DSM 14505]